MKFIKVHYSGSINPPVVYIAIDKIEAIRAGERVGSVISYPAHNDGGLRVVESAEEVLLLISEASRPD